VVETGGTVDAALRVADRHDAASEQLQAERRGERARVAEPLNRDARISEIDSEDARGFTNGVPRAARRRIVAAERAPERQRLSGDRAGRRVPPQLAVLVHHPA